MTRSLSRLRLAAALTALVCAQAAQAQGTPAAASAVPAPSAVPTASAGASAAHVAKAPAAAKPAPAKPAPAKPAATDKLQWKDLSPAQQSALEPLVTEWDRMGNVQKQKWLTMSKRFATMKPDEQQRMHERMRDWVRLTPEQRTLARENYTRTRQIDKSSKSEKWQQYQQLPEEEKKKLAAAAASKKQPGNGAPKALNGAHGSSKAHAPVVKACPAGSVANLAAATPACVPAPAAAAASVPATTAPAAPAAPPAPNAK